MINQDCKIWYILDIPSPNSTQMICNEWAAFQMKLPRAFRCGFFPFSLSASFCILYADFTFDKKKSEVCSREQRLCRITKTSSLNQVWSLTQLELCSVANKGHRKKWVFTYRVYFPLLQTPNQGLHQYFNRALWPPRPHNVFILRCKSIFF